MGGAQSAGGGIRTSGSSCVLRLLTFPLAHNYVRPTLNALHRHRGIQECDDRLRTMNPPNPKRLTHRAWAEPLRVRKFVSPILLSYHSIVPTSRTAATERNAQKKTQYQNTGDPGNSANGFAEVWDGWKLVWNCSKPHKTFSNTGVHSTTSIGSSTLFRTSTTRMVITCHGLEPEV